MKKSDNYLDNYREAQFSLFVVVLFFFKNPLQKK
jgi:hypothetical protein